MSEIRIPINSYTKPLFSDDKGMDAFNRVRVSNPETLFANQFQYGINSYTMYFDTIGEGTLTHLPNESAVQMTVGENERDRVVVKSSRYIHYQPGMNCISYFTNTNTKQLLN